MVDVKIPKIFNIDKSYVIEQLDGFIREIAYNYIMEKLRKDPREILNFSNACVDYYWKKFNKTGQVVFTSQKAYNYNMDNGRKRFKDSCYAKIDWIMFTEALCELIDNCNKLSWNVHTLNSATDEEAKKDLMYSIIMRGLLQEPTSEESAEEDKITGENDQKRPNP